MLAVFGDPDGLQALERQNVHFLRVAWTAQILGRGLDVQVQRGARQADGVQYLAAHLRLAGKDMFDARTSNPKEAGFVENRKTGL